jgi:hypothetical protein
LQSTLKYELVAAEEKRAEAQQVEKKNQTQTDEVENLS